MSILAKYLWGAGTLTVQAVVQRLLGAITSIVLARGLGATGFGAYSAVLNTASSAYGMVRLGVDAAIHVYTARGREDAEASRRTGELLGAGLSILATAGILAGTAVAIAGEWLAVTVFGQPDLAGPMRFAGVLTALQCLSQFGYTVLAGLQEFVVYARLMIVNAILILALSATGMWLFGLPGALGGYGIAQAILAASLGRKAAMAMRKHGVHIAYSRLAQAVSSLMRLGIPFYLSGLVVVPVNLYLQGLLSRSAGVDSLGLLRVIGTITALVAFVPGAVAAATTSMLTRTRAGAHSIGPKVFDFAFLHIKAIVFLTTMMAIGLVILTPILIEALFGAQYAGAIRPGTLALFSTVLSSTASAAGSLFFAVERSSLIFWQSVCQSLVMILVGLLIIPSAGVFGYVSAEFAGNLVGVVFTLVVATRMYDSGWGENRLVQAIGICAIAAFVSLMALSRVAGFAERTLVLALTVLLATWAMFWFGFSPWERSIMRRVVQTLLRRDEGSHV